MDAALLVYEGGGSTLSGAPTLATRAAFRMRGQSSAMFPKPPYRLELRDARGDDAKLPLLGMPEISGGYIFKFEWMAAEEPLLECTGASHCWTDLEVVDPEPLGVEQEAWLGQHLTSFVDVLFGPSFGDPANGYAAYIDVPSFVDQVIVNELGREMDAYLRSQHFHKDRDTKIFAGPIWDRDLVFGVGGFFENQNVQGWQWDQVAARDAANDWFPRLVEDPGFQTRLATRWRELRQGLLSDAQLDARVDALAAPLAAAATRNFARWPILGEATVSPFQTPTSSDWQGQITFLRDWMHQRVAWLDTQWP